MKHVPLVVVATLLLTPAVSAEETVRQTVTAENAGEHCSQQVWPNFSPNCLRNGDRAISIRLISVNRR